MRPGGCPVDRASSSCLPRSLPCARRISILDEPTAQLDPEGTRLVGEALRRLAGTGTGLLIAEHKTDLLADICDRLVVIDGGRLVAEGPAEQILSEPALEGHGVEPPTAVRLERALVERGLDPELIRG